MSNLEFPKTVRFAGKGDLPRAYWDTADAWQEAHFVEGFVLTEVEDTGSVFRFYAEVNVHNSRLWEVLVALATILPDVCACVFFGMKM